MPKKKHQAAPKYNTNNEDLIQIDPSRIRFQHARIRPVFSGCGRSVVSTLDSIRNGELTPNDLPPIQVIVGPDEHDGRGPWYFSLNNRRLWVLKRCRDEGLLPNNVISVRVRQPKSASEFERYSIANCAIEAKFMREKDPKVEIVKDHNSNLLLLTDDNLVEKIQNFDIDCDTSKKEEEDSTDMKSDACDKDSENDVIEESQRGVNHNRFCFDDSSTSSDGSH